MINVYFVIISYCLLFIVHGYLWVLSCLTFKANKKPVMHDNSGPPSFTVL